MLPPPDFRVEPALAAQGLLVTVVNQEGHVRTYDFAALPAPEPMQCSLAAAFAEQSAGWTSHQTAYRSWRHLTRFARFLSDLDQLPHDVDELTAAMLKRWRAKNIGSTSGRSTLNAVRVILLRDPRVRSGAVAEELARRIPRSAPSKQSYEDAERDRVLRVARRQFRAALIRIRDNNALLERWRAADLPVGSRDERLGRVLDHLARTGDVPRIVGPTGRPRGVRERVLLGGTKRTQTWGRLFLTRLELTALAVLLTDKFAWNLSVFDRMPIPTTTPSAGERTSITYQVQVEKRRRGVGRWFSTENITDSGADSLGRLITEALEATAHGRRLAAHLAPGVDLLMIARNSKIDSEHRNLDRPLSVGPLVFGVSGDDAARWVQHHGLAGSPFQRARRTTVVREGPRQHTRGTHESVYVLPDKRVHRASRAVVEAGAEEALELARAVVFGGHLSPAPEPTHQPTATVDCANPETSPWPGRDGGCGADFLLCLACPNAHVHPGHYSRLAHLREQLHSLRSAVADRDPSQLWQEHLLRLDDLRSTVGPAAWTAAMAHVTDADRALITLLLEGSLAP